MSSQQQPALSSETHLDSLSWVTLDEAGFPRAEQGAGEAAAGFFCSFSLIS